MRSLIYGLLFLSLISSCKNGKKNETPLIPVAMEDTASPKPFIKDILPVKPLSLLETTVQVLTFIKAKDYAGFSNFIHPAEGIRFSAYGYIDTTTDLHFSAASFNALLGQKNKKIVWGSYDGSGDPIRLTLNDYFKRFVYDADFLHAEKTAENKMTGGGNSLNNLYKIYPDAPFTESYFSGFDKKSEGMDWVTLRLVYKKYEGRFYLVAVVHDQWTI